MKRPIALLAIIIGGLGILGVYTSKIRVAEVEQIEILRVPEEQVEPVAKKESVIDTVIKNNRNYAENRFDAQLAALGAKPSDHLAIVACMDTRLDVKKICGLNPGQANVIRNAGGVITEDVLRSLIISYYALGTREFMIIQHTKCGVLDLKDSTMNKDIKDTTGYTSERHYHGFDNLKNSVKNGVAKVKNYPAFPKDLIVRGFIYDVSDGLLKEVE